MLEIISSKETSQELRSKQLPRLMALALFRWLAVEELPSVRLFHHL